MADIPVRIISPATLQGTGEIGPFPLEQFERKYLAQGDSWFSIGSIPPGLTSNILDNLVLSRSSVAVTCAFPGAVIARMVETTRNVQFLRLLRGRLALTWDAILLSGGGNDLIDAAGSDPAQPPNLRIFKTPQERGAGPLQPDDYISDAGWITFATHITAVFDQLIKERDKDKNRNVPLVFHTYAPLMPRPAPAGLGFGPWLQPSMTKFAIPSSDGLAVATALINRLATLLQQIIAAQTAANPNCALHLVDSRNAGLLMAAEGSTGVSGDFQNEIHLTNAGYKKVGAVWRQTLDAM
jgi:hypothetical protein